MGSFYFLTIAKLMREQEKDCSQMRIAKSMVAALLVPALQDLARSTTVRNAASLKKGGLKNIGMVFMEVLQ